MPDQPFFDRFKTKPSDPTKNLTMRQVFSVAKPRKFPSWKQWKRLPSVLSIGEKRVAQSAVSLFILSLLTMGGLTLFAQRVEVAAHGGEYTEALIGEPQLINPLYATTNDTDQDLVALIYSGLVRWDPVAGLVPDLAETIETNEEKTVYTVTLRENAQFHNGDPVLARDILFTISAIQNPAYRSPLAANFRGVSVVQEDDLKLSFILEKPQANFLDHLTVGILPSSAWADILPQNAPIAALNLQPIGSGPYQFAEFSKDKKGVIRTYSLESFHQYVHGEPFIDRLTFKFYPDILSAQDALANKFVEGVSIVPFEAQEQTGQNKAVVLHSSLLSREVVLYFNQKTNEQLKKLAVRQAIAQTINPATLIEQTLFGGGQVLRGPLLQHLIQETAPTETPLGLDLEKARTTLKEAGVVTEVAPDPAVSTEETTPAPEPQKPTNTFTLTTTDSQEFVDVANAIKDQLAQVGLSIEIQTVPAEALYEEVIKPQNYELLLTTLMFNTDGDPYVFWHSSQKLPVGLNIVEYANAEVDKQLDAARGAQTEEAKRDAYLAFEKALNADVPAIFLYQSHYRYAISRKVHLEPVSFLRVPSDRFQSIQTWYIKTKQSIGN